MREKERRECGGTIVDSESHLASRLLFIVPCYSGFPRQSGRDAVKKKVKKKGGGKELRKSDRVEEGGTGFRGLAREGWLAARRRNLYGILDRRGGMIAARSSSEHPVRVRLEAPYEARPWR